MREGEWGRSNNVDTTWKFMGIIYDNQKRPGVHGTMTIRNGLEFTGI